MIATLRDLAKMLGLSEANAGDSLTSERAAKAVLSRRNLFVAGAAMATGACFSFEDAYVLCSIYYYDALGSMYHVVRRRVLRGELEFAGFGGTRVVMGPDSHIYEGISREKPIGVYELGGRKIFGFDEHRRKLVFGKRLAQERTLTGKARELLTGLEFGASIGYGGRT